jgi:glycerophosphoryl diester phosphodiesterase
MLLLQAFVLLPNAHAHNDYAHPRPLLDALDQGFLSVEADIYLVDGELRVGHDREDLKPGRTLEALYLNPLAKRVRKNKGTVYGQPGVLTLLVDIKEDGARVQDELTRRLPKYRAMLSERKGSTVRTRAVQIVLSGARTADCATRDGFLFKDGRPVDLGDEPFRTPLISESYATALGTSASPLPSEGRAKLDDLVRRTHAAGKRFRLWGTPDGPTTWGELRSAGLDLINTDRLADLRTFLCSLKTVQ